MEQILADVSKNYYINIRKFATGKIEAVMKPVRPLNADVMEARADDAAYSQHCREKGASALDGFPKRCKIDADGVLSDFQQETNHERAVRRAKQQIRWLTKNMGADRLFTLTYRENVEDRERVRRDFKEFLRLVRKGFTALTDVVEEGLTVTKKVRYAPQENWLYVAVLERQERGAFHIHCAVKGWQKVALLRAAWYRALGGAGNESGELTPGAVNVTPPTTRWGGKQKQMREWKTEKLAQYLTKYLYKTFDSSASEKKRYWHSKDVVAPVKIQMWVGGANVIEAIKAAVWQNELLADLSPDWDMWLSPDYCTFWLAGNLKGA